MHDAAPASVALGARAGAALIDDLMIKHPVVFCEACRIAEEIDVDDMRSAVGFVRTHQLHGDVFLGDDLGDGDVACVCVLYHSAGDA